MNTKTNSNPLPHIRWAACADGYYRAAVFAGAKRISPVGRISFETDAIIAGITGRRGLELLWEALSTGLN